MGNRLFSGKFLDTRGETTLAIAVCDRCNRKVFYSELRSDPNFPGMRVCRDDVDDLDPWRLAARETEVVTLRHPRPDVSVALPKDQILTTDGIALNEEPNPPPVGNVGV